jgi:hypothetical protein
MGQLVPLHHGGGGKTVCYSTVMRGGFTVVGLFGSKFVDGDRGGDSHEIELYIPPKASAFAPSWAPVCGGTLHTVTGTNLRPPHGQGGQPSLICTMVGLVRSSTQ